ncbi:NAD(P)-dependent oxidoreductase, partial [Campylobacter jejuni]|nr:NAD(P)-dependent oxidoreductase [Campylobacter jejuni]
GFIGSNFIRKYHNKYDIIALVRKNSDISNIKDKCVVYTYDKDIDKLLLFLQKENIQGVVHLAALYFSKHSPSDVKKLFNSNILFGLELLDIFVQLKIGFFINTVTFSQFANSIHYKPKTLYDATKQAFMDLTNFYSSYFDIVNLMIYDNYGNNDIRPKIFNFWKKISLNEEILDMSPGEQKIDITHIDDVIDGFDILISMCIEKKIINNQIYTLENTRYTLKELANLFEQYTKRKINIKWGAREYSPNEIMEPISSKSSSKLMRLPNWKPKISLQEGLNNFLKEL